MLCMATYVEIRALRHEPNVFIYRCGCTRTTRVRFERHSDIALCTNCGTVHLRGDAARAAGPQIVAESAVESDAISPLAFRFTDESVVRVSGGDGMYGIDRSGVTYICSRCVWSGGAHELVQHYESHMRKLAQAV